VEDAAVVAVTGEAIVARGVVGRARPLRGVAVAGEAVSFPLRQLVGVIARQARRPVRRRPQRESQEHDRNEAAEESGGETQAHRPMLTFRPVRRELIRDAAIYLAAAVLLGTGANLVPSRHLAWWGKGLPPPREGVDFTLLDATSADLLRTSLPHVVFLDTRTAGEFAAGHVPGAERLSFSDLRHTLTPALVKRLSGADAAVLYGASTETDIEQLIAQALRLRGFAPPYVLVGGFPAWQAGGLAVTPPGSAS
jgi:rhodanese-related sulfurtransferase